ncbi:ATP synthase F1 subunit delta [Mycoplasmopsis cricetuli]|uniref:ATP synthase F1 subunit delta n=1 Tax=Mycoplasmopsis cricetuli TaxID=171283 RepID=UPI00046F4CDE|nr:ATP synthase F1 subunit delta [Mycoplasmopsis cricetuli]
MLNKTNVKGYAIALFELVKEINQFELIHEQMENLLKIFKQNPELIDFLNNQFILQNVKLKLIDDILIGFNSLIKNTVKVILERKMIAHIKKIIIHYLKISNEKLEIIFVKIVTASPISKQLLDKIIIKLQDNYQQKLEIRNLVDPSLISGFQIIFDSSIIQNNYKNSLNKLLNEIIVDKSQGSF